MHTAMCVVGKNYRLQDIQLSMFFCARCRSRWLTPPAGLQSPTPFRSPFGDGRRTASPTVSRRRFLPTSAHREAMSREDYGEYRARTGDLLVANQALSQLS